MPAANPAPADDASCGPSVWRCGAVKRAGAVPCRLLATLSKMQDTGQSHSKYKPAWSTNPQGPAAYKKTLFEVLLRLKGGCQRTYRSSDVPMLLYPIFSALENPCKSGQTCKGYDLQLALVQPASTWPEVLVGS